MVTTNSKTTKERASEALKSVNKVRRFVMPKKGEAPSEIYLELQKAKNQLVSLIKLLSILLLLNGTAGADSLGDLWTDTAKPDPLHEGEYVTEDRYGHRTGYIEKDPLYDDRYKVKDNYGHERGVIRKDPLHPDSFLFEDKCLSDKKLKRGDRTKIIREERE